MVSLMPDPDQDEDRAAGLRDHQKRMEFGFERTQAWCDVLHAMANKDADLNPLSMFLIAEALEGVLSEMKRDWGAFFDDLD